MAEGTVASQDWRARFREARRQLDLTQEGVAKRAGVSKDTVRAYETGRRLPENRDRFIGLLEALEFSRAEQNLILESLGFAPKLDSSNPALRSTWYQLADLDQVVERVPWPAFYANELMELVGANGMFQALVGVDLRVEFQTPAERNLVVVASNPRFADRAANWDELVRMMIAIAKGNHYRPETLEQPSPYFARVLEEFAKGDPRYVSRLGAFWDEVPLLPNRQRWEYPVVWDDMEFGRLNLLGLIVSSDHTQTMISFHDWIPTDASSWAALEKIKERHRKTIA